MIHDATVEVTCDNCPEYVRVEPEYVYHSHSGRSGQYDTSDSAIERELVREHEWIVIDGKHYCCRACAGEVPASVTEYLTPHPRVTPRPLPLRRGGGWGRYEK